MKTILRFKNKKIKLNSDLDKGSVFTGIIFFSIILVVFVLNAILPDKKFSSSENRMLQDRPSFSLSSYFDGQFEKKADTYATDQFLFRDGFIKLKVNSDLTLGMNKSGNVYKCSDSYLMEDITVPKSDTLKNAYIALDKFKKKNSKLKINFLLAPNAANLLSDKLPFAVRTADQNKLIDNFFTKIEKMGISPIDVRPSFLSHRDDTQLYYRTDHHWTTDGAFLAYKVAAKKMKLSNNVTYKAFVAKNDFLGTLVSKSGFENGMMDSIKIYLPDHDKDYRNSIISYADSKTKTTKFYQLENLDKKDAYTVFGGSNHPLYTVRTPLANNNKKLLIIKDSYANSFIPFIAQDYKEIVVVDPRYYYDDIQSLIKSKGINQVLFLFNSNTFFETDNLSMLFE